MSIQPPARKSTSSFPESWKIRLEQGFDLQSSGTTGVAKILFQPPEKLAAANAVALEAQGISRRSRILTVCNMNHAGGVLAQTLPALSIGAQVDIQPFNAFRFCQDIEGYTHTHLTPAHCEMLINTRTFADVDLSGLFITCGSDNVGFNLIAAFVRRGAIFMCNWGMTEIGPIAINTVFDSLDKVERYRRQALDTGSLMGDRYYCDTKLEQGCLAVKGTICIYPGWINSRDRVAINDQGAMYHLGRAPATNRI
ncbi:MAG: AMP-binding protein [Hyphomicrobiales bacterium]